MNLTKLTERKHNDKIVVKLIAQFDIKDYTSKSYKRITLKEIEKKKVSYHTLQNISDIVTGYYDTTLEEVQKKGRSKENSLIKKICYHLFMKHLDNTFTLKEYSKFFKNKTHGNVLFHLKEVSYRLTYDKSLIHDMNSIDKLIIKYRVK